MNRANRVAWALAGWMAAVLAGGFNGAQAQSRVQLKTAYEVDVGGITVLDIEYSVDISPTGYQSRANIETRGVVTFFSDYQMKMAVSGSLGNGRLNPAEYTSRRKKKDKTKAVTLDWSNGSPSKSGGSSKRVEAALTPASVDPLTAILRVGAVSNKNPCQATERIFDGREVFDLLFKFVKEVRVDDSWPGAYRGMAYECRLTYLPVAGKNADKFKEGKEDPETFAVWFAPVATNVSGGSLLVLVRAAGTLDGLKFVAYASHAEIGGRPFNQYSDIRD